MDNLTEYPLRNLICHSNRRYRRTAGRLIYLLLLCLFANTPRATAQVALPAEQTLTPGAGKGGFIYLNLRVNGHKDALFVLDTGASFTLLDNSLAAESGASLGKKAATDGTTGQKKELQYYRAPELFLGETRLLTDPVVFATDMTLVRRNTGRLVMGILGMDCLQNYCLQLDFDTGKLRFLEPDIPANTNSGMAFALKMTGGMPAIGENLLGVPDFDTVIDTGDTGAGRFQAALWQQAPGVSSIMVTNGPAVSISGVHADVMGRFTNCVLRGEVYDLILEDGFVNAVGLKFLAYHEVTLDFPRMKLYLKRRAESATATQATFSGFTLLHNRGEMLVLDVEPFGVADAAGIQPGDKLVELNGSPANTMPLEEIKTLFKSSEGKEVSLTLRRGDKTIQSKLVVKRGG